LQHYIFPAGGDGLYLVVDEKGKFREDNFQKAVNAVTVSNDRRGKDLNGKRKRGSESDEQSDIFKLVKMIMLRQFDPVIVFSFSKRECESLAMQV
jgi:ATP-dependent RNA helicase DOB1